MKPYNRASAASYARKYVTKPNKHFHYYWKNGDCTNFVSQALWAGGFPMFVSGFMGAPTWAAKMREDALDETEGWHFNHDVSPAWASAVDFKHFLKLSGRGRISNRFLVQMGDVVQIVNADGTDDGDGAHHTMLVTATAPPSSTGGLGGANIWLTYHSRNKVDIPLAEVEQTLEPQQQLLFWKISDTIRSPSEMGPSTYSYGDEYDGS
jgi:hypothetical protein